MPEDIVFRGGRIGPEGPLADLIVRDGKFAPRGGPPRGGGPPGGGAVDRDVGVVFTGFIESHNNQGKAFL